NKSSADPENVVASTKTQGYYAPTAFTNAAKNTYYMLALITTGINALERSIESTPWNDQLNQRLGTIN
ncbi:hypothetical protein DPMN_132384, partial [Dreissena polymorpha]